MTTFVLRGGNAKLHQNIPALFREIIRHDAEVAAKRKEPVLSFAWFKNAFRERAEYSRGAERALKWNSNKGSTA